MDIEKTFPQFAELISQSAGIQLAANRKSMLVNRIRSRVRHLDLTGYKEYLTLVKNDTSGAELSALIDAVTTNYTQFYRDEKQFTHLGNQLVEMMQSGRDRIRIWSAACSSGEEAYSLAITAHEAAMKTGRAPSMVRILATDIADSVLKKASKGVFNAKEVALLPSDKHRYFDAPVESTGHSRGKTRRVVTPLREMVIFRKLNLCSRPWEIPGNIDVIFCRNVLIYFDAPTKQRILNQCMNKLADDGLLYVGACESVRSMVPDLQSVQPSVFQKTTDVNEFEQRPHDLVYEMAR